MTTLTKILIAIGSVITIGILGLLLYNQEQIKNQQTMIQTQIVAQQQLVDGIVRSQSQYASKDDIQHLAEANGINLQAIQDNLAKLNASLVAVNIITTDSNTQNQTNVPSTNTGPSNPNVVKPVTIACPGGGTVNCPNTDPFGYMAKQQNLDLNEDFTTIKVPFGTVGFSAWQQKPWDISIAAREYNVDTVVGTDENQRQYFYNKFTVKVNNKDYDIPIKNATSKQEVPAAKFSWFNPRLLMGADAGININHVKADFIPSLNVGIMSYGQYKNSPDWSILEVGLGYATVNKTAEVVVTPLAYNFGRNLLAPFMNNTYIAPSLSIGTDGSFTVGAGLRVGF